VRAIEKLDRLKSTMAVNVLREENVTYTLVSKILQGRYLS